MKIKYCQKYEKYVSQRHCEFFNEGAQCEYYSPKCWNSIKDLLADQGRPKWDVNAVIKPFKCNLLDREYLNLLNRKKRLRKGAIAARG
ncbi:hypothetical protein [Desulforhabdus amnigena]|jgi:hypothetical protein|uniref:Uncharacterized protein n=1 Tax=Desulforhabdus amnigena TaxID=40218 RepID=A0A9W6FTB0_9BACT|nr:hypothetical protein [Desulforhabdus amnigena]NLJ27893.1 hypothetical protein [Deltaproteobacteria bacterium]GLI32796.1 hypothetical protein DAMNIGENAA_02290 [Desulforhabdus amnigena]